ncbi:MAG TPA: XTP/dITP diphosphatase [Chloroflexi bacterium]|nr:XTP/dITP diphosphatase [Chloroflexota bacterium]
MKVLIATRNRGKLREYADLLADLTAGGQPIEWVSLADLGIEREVEETGTTFEENARLKATAYARESGLLTLADDSGLEVDALGGAPGVHSARYGGPELDDEGRYRLLLEALKGVPEGKRSARFRCVVAITTPEGELHTAEGTCEGRIAREPKGEHGFGYDPVFVVEEYGRTMAELGPEIKNRISHRARALEAIRPVLATLLVRHAEESDD